MADLEFNRQDIQDLAQKLSTIWQLLNDKERALLLAIFAAAASNATPSTPDTPATLPEATGPGQGPGAGADYQATIQYFRDQLLNAYTPGSSFDSVTEGGDVGRIGAAGAAGAAGGADAGGVDIRIGEPNPEG
jgi:hypothetical protein